MLRPGILEAVNVFWSRIDRVTPCPVTDRTTVTEALLLALASLNLFRDGHPTDPPPPPAG